MPGRGDEAEAALPMLSTYPEFEHLQKGGIQRTLVWDDRSSDDELRHYITPRVHWVSDMLLGRATYGYIAHDVERGTLVYLKDFWRLDHPGKQKEGGVYHELHEAQVPNIAKLGPASDVLLAIGDGQAHRSVVVQRTRTCDYLNHPWCLGRPRVEPYVHYQLVLETVGTSLNRFKSTRQLCEVMGDAVVGKGKSPCVITRF